MTATIDGEFIVKIQRPLGMWPLTAPAEALIYNADRSVYALVPFQIVRKVFNAGTLKVYYYATMVAGNLSLDRVAPEQDW